MDAGRPFDETVTVKTETDTVKPRELQQAFDEMGRRWRLYVASGQVGTGGVTEQSAYLDKEIQGRPPLPPEAE